MKIRQMGGERRAIARKRGSALLLSMMFVLLVAGMGVAMVQVHSAQARRQDQAIDNKRAIYIAEAGLAESFFAMSKGMSGNIGTPEQPAAFGTGLYWVEATNVDASRVALVSTGLVDKGRFAVGAVLQRQYDPIASLGFYSCSDLQVGRGVIIDGFESSLGTYRSQLDRSLPGATTGKLGKLAAKGDIVLAGSRSSKSLAISGSTMIYGDAQPGELGAVSIGTGVTVTGSTAPLGPQDPFPPVEIPVIASKGNATITKGGFNLDQGKYGYGTFVVKAGASARIRGPALVVFDQLVLEAGASLKLDSSAGRITIYVRDRLFVAPSAILNSPSEDSQGLTLMVAASSWFDFDGDGIAEPPLVFEPEGEFYGYLYAPDADMQIGSMTHFIGGLAAKSVSIADGGRLSFDHTLGKLDQVVTGLPLIVAWRIAPIPDVPITQANTTPLKYLQEQGTLPVNSPDASLDRYMKLRYYDLAGFDQRYEGLFSGFDWSNVGEVTRIEWDDDPVIGDEGLPVSVPRSRKHKKKI